MVQLQQQEEEKEEEEDKEPIYMLSQLVYFLIFSTLSVDNLEHYRICSQFFRKTISFKYPLINYHGGGNVLMLTTCNSTTNPPMPRHYPPKKQERNKGLLYNHHFPWKTALFLTLTGAPAPGTVITVIGLSREILIFPFSTCKVSWGISSQFVTSKVNFSFCRPSCNGAGTPPHPSAEMTTPMLALPWATCLGKPTWKDRIRGTRRDRVWNNAKKWTITFAPSIIREASRNFRPYFLLLFLRRRGPLFWSLNKPQNVSASQVRRARRCKSVAWTITAGPLQHVWSAQQEPLTF